MKKYSEKELIKELIIFFQSGNRKCICVEQYIKLTSKFYQWDDQRKRSLYRALERTKAFQVSYYRYEKNVRTWIQEEQRYKKIAVSCLKREVTLLK